MRHIFLTVLAAVMTFSLSAQDLTILHFNDTHSHIDPQRSGDLQGRGGVIEQAAFIDQVRSEEGKRMSFCFTQVTSVREHHILQNSAETSRSM